MNPYHKHIPTGRSLPFDNPHAISVSLPRISDVIAYEQNNGTILRKMQSGYPRFFVNKLVAKLIDNLRVEYGISDQTDIFALMSAKARDLLFEQFDTEFRYVEKGDCFFLLMPQNHPMYTPVKDFIRQSGLFLASRKAEDLLFSIGKQEKIFDEMVDSRGADFVKAHLAEAYDAGGAVNVMLSGCGMNAIFAVLNAVIRVRSVETRQCILQIGCLYVDSDHMIRYLNPSSISIPRAKDRVAIEKVIELNHSSIVAVYTEIPNNPLVECTDLTHLHELCQHYDLPLIIDSTIGTPHNMHILPFCDIAIESLTKFACGTGDVMMGAVILNPLSDFAQTLKPDIEASLVQPYQRDCQRMAFCIRDYDDRVAIVSANTRKLIAYFQNSPVIAKVYSALDMDDYPHFMRIRKHADALPGLINITFKKDFIQYYDRINLPKGPSLGTNFTLLMPYVLMAHYENTTTPEGRVLLGDMGLEPEMLRVSVGIEPVDQIIEVLAAAGI
jgi:cystathionine gamma-synthase